jgi:putative thiamine transport system ATP-binding protein
MSEGLVLSSVSIALQGVTLLSVDATVPPGETLTIMGASGSGKSTLLRYVVGALMPPFRGSGLVRLDGRVLNGLPPQERGLGLLFQDDLLFPHLSVGGNLLFGLAAGGSKAERRTQVEAALADVGLDGFCDRDPATLSGGQRARVSLMRVLLSQPKALLLDEPFSKLDAALREQTRSLIFGEIARRRLPAILVTHDLEDAAAAGGPVIRFG